MVVENMEIWKDIKGYKGYYQISNKGRVKSLSRKKHLRNNIYYYTDEIILKPGVTNGYQIVVLQKNKIKNTFLVHHLVLKHYVKLKKQNRKNNVCNHINGLKHDNRDKNLEWCSQKENAKHSCMILKKNIGSDHYKSILNENILRKIKNKLKQKIKVCVIAKQFNVSPNVISHIKNNRTWKHIK